MTRTKTLRLQLLATALAAGLIIFWPAIYKVGYGVLHRHGSSHGVFIPFISAYFIYLKWERLKRQPTEYWWPGIAAMLFCAIISRMVLTSIELQFIFFVLYIALAVYTCLGKPVFRMVLFPILFAITMVPIPKDLYVALAEMTRRVTFSASLGILSLFDIPYYKEGWLIKLPNALLEVAISCSGIRYLISYFVFGIAYAYLFRQGPLARTLLIGATIPISLIASSLRLVVIFLATFYISPRMAEPWPHVILSWFVFFTILFSLICFDQYFLGKKKKQPQEIGMAAKHRL